MLEEKQSDKNQARDETRKHSRVAPSVATGPKIRFHQECAVGKSASSQFPKHKITCQQPVLAKPDTPHHGQAS